MNKQRLLSIWKSLDQACNTVETLGNERYFDDKDDLLGQLVSLKSKVEEDIMSRTREGSKDPFAI